MNSTRIWVIACGAAIIAVLGAGFALGVQPQIAAAATTSDSVMTIDAQNQATMIKIAGLSKAAAKVDSLKAENDVLLKSMPFALRPNTFIRRINEVAALDGVAVSAVTLGDSAAYIAPAASSAGSATLLAKTDPAITAANFASIPVVVDVTGTAAAAVQFVHDIQADQRVFAVNGVKTTIGDAGVTNTTLSGYIYTLKR